jgi:hypothetical protein
MVVTEVAPEELDLFDELIGEYFRNPAPPKPGTASPDDPLGFGLGETMAAVVPAAGAMVSVAIQFILTEFVNTTTEETAEAMKAKIRSLFKKEENQVAPEKQDSGVHPLTKEQLEAVKKLARKQAVQFGISPEEANKMANALIGSLALI